MADNLPPFLRLTSHLRHQIYSFLASNDYGVEFWDRQRFVHLGNLDHDNKGPWLETVHALLLTCRTIYEEVSQHVYSKNHFFCRYTETEKLEPLRRLRPSSIKALKSLTIHLSNASCGLGDTCYRVLEPWYADEALGGVECDRPFKAGEERTRIALKEWKDVWSNHLLPYLARPAQLDLSIVCDVADIETARAFTRPLMMHACNVVSDISIRLSHRASSELKHLAKTIGEAIVSRPSSARGEGIEKPFRFLNLPAELRQQILTYTDLVTPFRQAEWDPTYGWFSRLKSYGGHHSSITSMHGRTQSRNVQFPSHDFPETYSTCWIRSRHNGCFCKAFHSAFSTIHECRCWAPPTYLFLVCRAMSQDAIQVFYQNNSIIIAPAGRDTHEAVDSSPSQLAISTFLSSHLSTASLRNLRYLEIVFPAFGETKHVAYCSLNSPEYTDWLQTIAYIKDKLDLPKLTLRVRFAPWTPGHPSDPGIYPQAAPPYRRYMTKTTALDIVRTYMRLTAPLKALRGLKHFSVEFDHPARWSEIKSPNAEAVIKKCERSIERHVMGEGYDGEEAAGFEEMRWEQMHLRGQTFWADLEARDMDLSRLRGESWDEWCMRRAGC